MTKRFWKTVETDGARVRLDGKLVRVPSGAILVLATPALALAVAAEWDALRETFTAADLPLTGLAGTAQERVRALGQGPRMAAALAQYAESDLLCYRVERPAALAAMQAAQWQPWLDWAARNFDAPLRVTSGIGHVAQPPESLNALRWALEMLSHEELAALGLAIPAMGSCVLGLALARRAISAAEAARVAAVEELFQQHQWGADADALARRAAVQADIELAARFMELSRDHTPLEPKDES